MDWTLDPQIETVRRHIRAFVHERLLSLEAAPTVDGRLRSAFVMTEPMPGAGSDPSMMQTRADKRGDRWVVHGRKWFITGAGVAEHFILIARTSGDARQRLMDVGDGLRLTTTSAGSSAWAT